MKRCSTTLLVITLSFLLLSTVGCGKPELYGNPVSETESTGLKKILSSPADYNGKTVKIEGTISEECPTGCWFNLKDDSGMIYVELSAKGIAIPQKVGSKVIVQGKVKVDGRDTRIIGEGVEIK